LDICNKTNFHVPTLKSDRLENVITFLDFLAIITSPLICVFGMITNILVVLVVSKKTNKNLELKENQYEYMRLNAVINFIYLSLQPMSLMNECQDFNDPFCSTVRESGFAQYFKIIFLEYISNSLTLASNLAYIGFAINRLSLVGKDHGKFVIWMSKLKIKRFMIGIIIPCLLLPIVKIFRFKPNFYRPDDFYPDPIDNRFISMSRVAVLVYFIFNILLDIINYFIFLIINLIIDINLAVCLKKTIDEKKNKKIAIVHEENK
jgi:hypothetical protein